MAMQLLIFLGWGSATTVAGTLAFAFKRVVLAVYWDQNYKVDKENIVYPINQGQFEFIAESNTILLPIKYDGFQVVCSLKLN